MLSIGYGGSIHDFAVVVADAEKILIGIEEERISRVRYSVGEIDPFRKGVDYVSSALGVELPSSETLETANDTVHWAPFLRDRRVRYLSHHDAHAASVAYTCGVDQAIVLVMDGAGSVTADYGDRHARETTSLYKLEGNLLTRLACVSGEKDCPKHVNTFKELTSNSLGDFYELVTIAAGFDVMQEGKTMALASFGDDRFVAPLWAKFQLGPGFAFSVRSTGAHSVGEYLSRELRGFFQADSSLPFDVRSALAYAAQCCVERVVEYLVHQAQEIYPSKNICVAGGVALNSVLIGKLPLYGSFDTVHVISAPGDSGTAVGAALFSIANATGPTDTVRWVWSPYIGREYPIEIASDLRPRARLYRSDESLAEALAQALAKGHIAAVFRGRSEFGPRALGNRSLMASANVDGVLARLNSIKGREWFRPVAPMTLEPGHASLGFAESQMQAVRSIGQHTGFPRAARHVDNSARVQLVGPSSPAFLERLLSYGKPLGIQAICNTSLNIRGQPIVETPAQAEAIFRQEDVDALVLGNWLIAKS